MLRRSYFWFVFLLLNAALLQADQGGTDSFGHMWTNSAGAVSVAYNWIDIRDGTSLFGAAFDDDTASVDLPFSIEFYGSTYSKIWVSTNGWVSFAQPVSGSDPSFPANTTIPGGAGPDTMLAVFWDNMIGAAGGGGGVYYKSIGTSPNRKFVIQWDIQRDDGGGGTDYNICEVVFYEHSNLIKFQYNLLTTYFDGGGGATIGIKENTTDGVEYSFNTSGVVSAGTAILFHNKYVDTADGSIFPVTAEVGSIGSFNYTIDNIDATPAGLGKADRFAISNPFSAFFISHGYKYQDK